MPTVSIEKTVSMGSDGGSKTLKDVLPDESEEIDDVLDRQKIISVMRHALSTLTPREERIVRLRFGISEPDDDHENYPITQEEYDCLVTSKESAQ